MQLHHPGRDVRLERAEVIRQLREDVLRHRNSFLERIRPGETGCSRPASAAASASVSRRGTSPRGSRSRAFSTSRSVPQTPTTNHETFDLCEALADVPDLDEAGGREVGEEHHLRASLSGDREELAGQGAAGTTSDSNPIRRNMRSAITATTWSPSSSAGAQSATTRLSMAADSPAPRRRRRGRGWPG